MKGLSKTLVFIFSIGILGAVIAATTPPAPAPIIITVPFIYSFNADGLLNEAGSMSQSSSPYWWVNSGGELIIASSTGETMQGNAPSTNIWQQLYARNNPTDTDQGLHPQNLFRLVTRSQWTNASVQARFNISKDNFSSSFNRNTSNGLLLMSRYAAGGQTLYYAGVRVDGTAVIKKKINGIYYTMAQTKVFPGTYTGWQDNVNLLPHNEWLSLRNQTITNADGSVTVTLSMQLPGQTAWTQLLSAKDSGQYGGTGPILGPGYEGIRTDFMDVQFKNFRIDSL